MIPPPKWIACDFVLHFSFVIAHILGKTNAAAHFLSRFEAGLKEKAVLKIREDVTVKPIEVNMESIGIAPEEPVFNTDDDLTEILEQVILKCKAEVHNRNTTCSQQPIITIAS